MIREHSHIKSYGYTIGMVEGIMMCIWCGMIHGQSRKSSQDYPQKWHFYPNFLSALLSIRVNSSRSQIVGDWCQQECPWQNLKLYLLDIDKKLLYQRLKKYFDNPFQYKHSHLPYGAIDGPPGRSLHFFLPISQGLMEKRKFLVASVLVWLI